MTFFGGFVMGALWEFSCTNEAKGGFLWIRI